MGVGIDAERSDGQRRMVNEPMVRPELVSLNSSARRRVLDAVSVKGGHCENCGRTEFDVGHALYMGYLFLDEDSDAYMVALTCRNPACAQPRTAIVLPENQFLDDDAVCAEARSAGARGDA